MADIFISHSSDTRDEAQALADALRARNMETFLDTDLFESGSHWQQELNEALHQTPCIAVVVGPEQERDARVRNAWSNVLQEVWSNDGKLLIPVLVRGAVLPPFLSRWQYLRPAGDWKHVAEEIAQAIQGSSAALSGTPAEADIYRRLALERIRRLKAEVAGSSDLQADSSR